MSYLMMIPAMAVLVGIAMLFYSWLRYDGTESMILAASTVVGLLFIGGKLHHFMLCIPVAAVLAAAGVISFAIFKQPKTVGNGVSAKRRRDFVSPAFVLMLLIFLYGLVAFFGDFVQNYDELNHWANEVKYMLTSNWLPVPESDYSGITNMPYAAALFHLFFQLITGFNEANLYTAGMLLVWMGFALCISKLEWKQWKSALIFAVVMYVALFSLYQYPYKSLYVDMPTAAWTGGLCSWWCLEKDRRHKLLLPIAMLAMICCFKMATGPLMAVFVVIFFIVQLLTTGRINLKDKKVQAAAAVLAVLAVLGAGAAGYLLLSGRLSGILPLSDDISLDKALKTLASFVTRLFNRKLSVSSFKVKALPFVLCVFAVVALLSKLADKKTFQRVFFPQLIAIPFGFAGYCLALYASYVLLFAYDESVNVASINRYFSIIVVVIFTMLMTDLAVLSKNESPLPYHEPPKAPDTEQLKIITCRVVAIAMLVIFSTGFNGNFIWKATSLNSSDATNYKVISTVKNACDEIDDILTEQDKVYMIVQVSDKTGEMGAAKYFLGNRVNGEREAPWSFNSDGSKLGITQNYDITIEVLPELLQQGGYTYFWIYNADEYLKKNLPNVAEVKIKEGGFYQVSFDENGKLILTLKDTFETITAKQAATQA